MARETLPKIGVICFASRKDLGKKISEAPVEALRQVCVPVLGNAVCDVNQARTISEMLDLGALSAIIFIAATVRTAIQMLIAARNLNLPILIWVPRPDEHALPSALQVVDALKKAKRWCRLVYGKPSCDKVMIEIERFVKVADVARRIERSRIGLMDFRVPQLISGAYNDIELYMNLGIETVRIDSLEMFSAYKSVDQKSVESLTTDMLRRADLVDATESDLGNAVTLYLAVKSVADGYNLDAAAVRGYPVFANTGTTAAFAASMLNDEGIMSNYEGDGVSAVTMLILHFLSKKPVFLAEPYKINEDQNTLMFFHRSAPMSLSQNHSRVKLYSPRILMHVPLKNGEVTIVRLGSNFKRLHAAVGTIVPGNQLSLACSEIEVKLGTDPRTFLSNAIGNHYSIVYGDYLAGIHMLSSMLDIEVVT